MILDITNIAEEEKILCTQPGASWIAGDGAICATKSACWSYTCVDVN